jgi:hypothetical protein
MALEARFELEHRELDLNKVLAIFRNANWGGSTRLHVERRQKLTWGYGHVILDACLATASLEGGDLAIDRSKHSRILVW